MQVIGFDVFGTLIDPGGMADAVRPFAGERTGELLAEWRRTQLEFAFRRAAMGRYVPFDQVTRAALDRAVASCGIDIAEGDRADLVAGWTRLPAFPAAAGALDALRAAGHRCLAFSNGTPAGLEQLLAHAGLDGRLDDVLSVEAVGTYKPAPEVYAYLARTGAAVADATWVVSGNAWDVIGARAAGLRAAWIRRDPVMPFDPWEEQPDLEATDLDDLAARAPFATGETP